MLLRKASLLIVVAITLATVLANAQEGGLQQIRFDEDVVGLEYIGNVNNSGANSSQFGYFNYVLSPLSAFNGTPEDAAHANFTFFTEAVTQRVTVNGTLRVVDRTGTTTVYVSTAPATFSEPDSFRSGASIQVSSLQQQVILDTTTGDFSVVNVNTVTAATPFSFAGQQYQLGKPGDRFRTVLRGKTNSVAPPGFFIAGYAMGAGKH